MTAILMFPAMLIGPGLSAVLLTALASGRAGLRDLGTRMLAARQPLSNYLMLLLPPALVLAVLLSLAALVSPNFAPNTFFMGVLFGLPAGFLEEIGWTGYAFPTLLKKYNALSAGVLLGLLWSLWHLPVVDHLGAASPHGHFWLPFFCSFAAAITAMRVIMGWLYIRTRSIFLVQLMHVSSTAALVIFSAPRATAAQEVFWYAVYAAALWLLAGLLAPQLKRIGPSSLARPQEVPAGP
jgi:membrane protease YdiL (CAAX protease family)